jgi:hypothetical protein
MAHTSRSASLSHKAPAGRFITDELGTNHLQRHGASKIYIKRFVSHPHCATAQFKRRPIFACEDLVMLEAQFRRQKSRPDGLGQRLLIDESSAQRTDGTGVAVIREQCTANRTGPFAFRSRHSITPRWQILDDSALDGLQKTLEPEAFVAIWPPFRFLETQWR